MTSEINKDEAYRCMEIGLAAKESGDLEKALKFLTKSKNMFSPLSEKVDIYIERIKKQQSENNENKENNNNNNKTSNNENNTNTSSSSHSNNNHHQNHSTNTNNTTHPRTRARASSKENASTSSSTNSGDYTKEQLEEVQKIKKCKTYYEVLGINKSATDDEIKKAYRKMALKFHPDKNRAPGADEAFKAVSAAYGCLRNADSRSSYDRHGYDVSNRSSASYADDDEGGRRRGYPGGSNFSYYSTNGSYREFTDDDLFDIFASVFGNSYARPGARRPQQTRTEYHQYTRPQQTQHQQQHKPSSCLQFLQFLPIILLFLFSMLNFGSFDQTPPFNFQWTPQYSVQRFANINNFKVPYYVNEKFTKEYPTENLIRQVEKQVILEHQETLRRNCMYEKQQQQRMTYNAQYYYGSEKEKRLKEAKNYVKENCKKYEEIYASAAA